MKADFHVHSVSSKDSLTDPESLIARAEALGFGKLILTDHNTISGALKLREKYPDYVIVGEEILTTSGEILALFVEREIPRGLAPLDALDRLKAQGAFISLSHPYAFARHGWREDEMTSFLPYLDAIEIGNARNSRAQNEAARRFAAAHDLCGTAGSDAHGLREFGRMGLDLPEFSTADELRRAIRSAQVFGTESSPLVRLYSRKAVLVKKIKKTFGSN